MAADGQQTRPEDVPIFPEGAPVTDSEESLIEDVDAPDDDPDTEAKED